MSRHKNEPIFKKNDKNNRKVIFNILKIKNVKCAIKKKKKTNKQFKI